MLAHLGLDPSILTFQGILKQLIAIALANINVANAIACVGGIFYILAYLMRTIVPLRIFGIIANVFFMIYGVLGYSMPTFFAYLFVSPINCVRLYQMLKLVRKARLSAEGDLSMDWLEPYMTLRNYRRNSIVFRKGDKANEMFIPVTGSFLVKNLEIELKLGTLFGEIGFLSPNNRRTQTVECVESGKVLTISYDDLLRLFFTNPEFGYYFLRLSSERLLQNIANLEQIIERNKDAMQSDEKLKSRDLGANESRGLDEA